MISSNTLKFKSGVSDMQMRFQEVLKFVNDLPIVMLKKFLLNYALFSPHLFQHVKTRNEDIKPPLKEENQW